MYRSSPFRGTLNTGSISNNSGGLKGTCIGLAFVHPRSASEFDVMQSMTGFEPNLSQCHLRGKSQTAKYKVKVWIQDLKRRSCFGTRNKFAVTCDIVSDISSDICSDILSGISPGILSVILSDISSDIPSGIYRSIFWHSSWHIFWHSFWHCILRLRSGREHWAQMVAVEVRQRTLGSDGRGWGLAGTTWRGWSRLSSGRERWGLTGNTGLQLCSFC